MNIIFVMSDTYRRDNLAVYGPSAVRTPNLDRFASSANVFHKVLTGSFPTVPNRLDIFSGRYCHTRGEWGPLPKDTITLGQLLTGAGLTTQMIVDNPHLLEDGYDYSRGFGGWEWIRGQETDAWRTIPRDVHIATDPRKMRTRFSAERHRRNTAWWRKEEDRFAARRLPRPATGSTKRPKTAMILPVPRPVRSSRAVGCPAVVLGSLRSGLPGRGDVLLVVRLLERHLHPSASSPTSAPNTGPRPPWWTTGWASCSTRSRRWA